MFLLERVGRLQNGNEGYGMILCMYMCSILHVKHGREGLIKAIPVESEGG